MPWIVLAIFVAYLGAPAVPLPVGPGSGFDVAAFGRLPVSANGRVQPFDTVARTALLQIRGSVTPIDGLKGEAARPSMIDPTVWLLEVLAKPDTADTRRVFPITNRELLGKLQLPAASRGTNYYAFNDLGPRAGEINKQIQDAANAKAPDRTQGQEELIALRDKLMLYERLKNSLAPNSRLQLEARGKPITFDFAAEMDTFRADVAEALRVDADRRRGGNERLGVEPEMRIRTLARLFQSVSTTGMLAVVPRPSTIGAGTDWTNLGSSVVQSSRGHQPPAALPFLAGMSSAFAQGKADAFNSRVAGYRQWLAANGLAPQVRKARLEALSNLLLPLVRAIAFYALALILVVVARRTRSAMVYRSALLIVVLASALHAAGIVLAMMLAGTPSWIAFLGWTAGGLAGLTTLVVERFRRNGNGTLATAAIGLTALVAAYVLAPGGALSLVKNLSDAGLVAAMGAAVVVLFLARESRTAARSASALQQTLVANPEG